MVLVGYLIGQGRRALHLLARLAAFDSSTHRAYTIVEREARRIEVTCTCGRVFFRFDGLDDRDDDRDDDDVNPHA